MKDKKLVTVLIAIIVLLLIGGAYTLGVKQNIKNSPEGCGFNGELCAENIQDPITWIKSKEFGIYYPSNWVASETWYLPESLKGYSEKEGTPEFSATNGNAIISWGGSMSGCKESEFDAFKPGVSITACYRGMETHIGLENVRNKITDEELKTFGDFVLKNQ